MTEFTPEVYLTAARIAWPLRDYVWCEELYSPKINFKNDAYRASSPLVPFDPEIDGDDYRALREALEKDYSFVISWVDGKWHSSCFHPAIHPMFDENIIKLMMQNVKALREAGEIDED